MKAMYLTQEQYDRLATELAQLKRVDRKKAISDIATAREHGDLKENAEYAVVFGRGGGVETEQLIPFLVTLLLVMRFESHGES